MSVTLVVAAARNGVIGRDGRLPWSLPADLRRFKRLTLGRPIVMGRRTWESIGRPLPGRRSVVLTRDPSWSAEGAEAAPSLEAALERLAGAGEVFVIGGEAVFRAALPLADRVELTRVEAEVEGDVRFPLEELERGWELVGEERHEADDRHAHPYAFLSYARRGG